MRAGGMYACVRVGVGAQTPGRAHVRARVAVLIQLATRCHNVICGLSDSLTFFDVISGYFGKKNFLNIKCVF
jgi:hypothetical protein